MANTSTPSKASTATRLRGSLPPRVVVLNHRDGTTMNSRGVIHKEMENNEKLKLVADAYELKISDLGKALDKVT